MLIQNVDEQSYHARADRRFAQAQVIAVDPIMHTCTLDVGARDVQSNSVLMQNVPFSPQTPPSVGDMVSLQYGNASPQSVVITGGQLGGQNSQGTISVVGAVVSLSAAGEPALQGAVQMAAGSGIVLTQASQTITLSSQSPTAGSASQPVASTGSGGSLLAYSRADHTHQGVHSVASAGGNQLSGDVVLAAGSGVSITQSGSTISIAAPPGTPVPASWSVVEWTATAPSQTYSLSASVAPPLMLLVLNSSNATVQLPSGTVGGPLVIKAYGSSPVTVLPAGSDTIDGQTSWVFGKSSSTGYIVLLPAQFNSVLNWMVIGLG